MTKQRKIDLLYAKATGGNYNPSPQEKAELAGYSVDFNEGKSYATKKNITAYVNAMEGKLIKRSFYDWCMDNSAGDRRRKSGQAGAMKARDSNMKKATLFLGWIPWALVLYYILGGALSPLACIIASIVISLILYKVSRQYSFVTVFVIPIVLAAIVYTLKG